MFFLYFFILFGLCETITINTPGHCYKQFNGNDILHIDMPDSHVAYVVLSENIRYFIVDSVRMHIDENRNARAFKIGGKTIEIPAEKKRLTAFIWIIPTDLCDEAPIWSTGENYRLTARQFSTSSNICVFPVYTAEASLLSFSAEGGSRTVYKTLSSSEQCSSESCSYGLESPLIIQLRGNVNSLSMEVLAVNEAIFTDNDKGTFTYVTSTAVTYLTEPAKLDTDKSFDFLAFLETNDRTWIVGLVLGTVGIVAFTIIFICCTYFFCVKNRSICCCCPFCKMRTPAVESDTNHENDPQYYRPPKQTNENYDYKEEEDTKDEPPPHVEVYQNLDDYPPAQPV